MDPPPLCSDMGDAMTGDEARGHSCADKWAARRLLERVRRRLRDPARWCKGHEAERADGTHCRARDGGAVRWCLIGASLREHHEAALRGPRADRVWALAMCWLGEKGVTMGHGARNDRAETTHEDLMAWLTRSIERARASE